MKMQCTHCLKQYEVSSALLGKTVACKACGKDFFITRLKDISAETNTTEETQESDNQRSHNRVAFRLNTIGDTIFVIIVFVSILSALGSALVAGAIDQNLVPWGLGVGIWFAIVNIIIFYIIKTLFNGFAELIQISHDIRKEMQSK